MLTFSWSSLRVINIRLNPKEPVEFRESLQALRELTNAYTPETCSRQVYIYDEKTVKDDIVNEHWSLKHIRKHSQKTELLEGISAYDFLLKWTLGLKSNKQTQDDIFVRGQLRARWSEYLESTPKKVSARILPCYQMLSEDGTGIRASIYADHYTLGITIRDKRQAIEAICSQCVEIRAKGLKPEYARLQSNPEELALQSIEARLRRVTKELSQLQILAGSDKHGVDILTPSFEEKKGKDSQKANFGRFRKSIKLVFEKQELMSQSEVLTTENPHLKKKSDIVSIVS